MPICMAVDCIREVFCKGLCGLHYKRQAAGHAINEHSKGQQSVARGGLKLLGLHKHHPFYMAWVNMKTRCNNPKSTQYKWYGGRGIQYNETWETFAGFYLDMWEGYSDGFSLYRKDPEGHYNKTNCRWIPLKNQAANRRPRAS